MKITKKLCLAAIIISIAVFVALFLFPFTPTDNHIYNSLISNMISRLAGSVVFILTINYLGINIFKGKIINAVFIIPCAAVALNNFPFIPVIGGNATVEDADSFWIIVLIIECVLVAVFEETAFRGTLTVLMCKNCKSTGKLILKIFIASAIFGLLHFVNLLEGADIGSVLVQIGYSTLIGAMCSALLFVCGNIIPCIIVHTVYNFCGQLGGEIAWDNATVIITVFVSVIAAAALVYGVIKHGFDNFQKIYSKTSRDFKKNA